MRTSVIRMKTKRLPEYPDRKLSAGADVRYLVDATVSELWYVLEGHGEICRDDGSQSSLTTLVEGSSNDIPVGTAFQYRNVSNADLRFICIKMPPLPGVEQATIIDDYWNPTF